MNDPAVVVDGVWKKFRKGERYDSLRDFIPAMARRALWRQPADRLRAHEFWALKDVCFEVRPGQAIGIVGPNGGGKSTVLKLLTRILGPTRGSCVTHGRIGALIEVAAGFHVDLTGRENIYLQGAILGMKRHEIARRFDEIVEFAGLADFIDTPIKRYSSGMNARLGFSIAAHLAPDVLIVDEVLGVGDLSFQEKCEDRMKEFKRRGVAIIFVSHNLQAVSSLCDVALFLNRAPQAFGETAGVLERYLAHTSAAGAPVTSGAMAILEASLTDASGHPVSSVAPGTPLVLGLLCRASGPVADYWLAFRVYRSTDGLPVYDASWAGEELGVAQLALGAHVSVSFRFVANLTRGHYHLAFHAYHDPTAMFLAHARPVATFRVEEQRTLTGIADLEVVPRAALTASRPAPPDDGLLASP